jgi:hypothetical protein
MPRVTIHAFVALLFMAGLAAEARASLIVKTPTGIAPGQSFIVTFFDYQAPVHAGGAESTNIATYNAAIASAASGITYSGGTIGAWQILGATATADPAATVFSSSLSVWEVGYPPPANDVYTETKLATTGATWIAGGSTPSAQQSGAENVRNALVWTGLNGNGTPDTGFTLGSANVQVGYDGAAFPNGLNGSGVQASSGYGQYYGFAIFTASPEPGTMTLSLLGLGAVGVVRLARRRRAARLSA